LLTSEEYYGWRIERILDRVLVELEREPTRVFSIEGLFFLRLYWDRSPHQRERIRNLVHQGRLRLSGTGITTPDTNIPHGESILRDYLHGQGWLRRAGLNVEPRLAYLPDSFGHSPALPSLLR
jgi:alpha-mannosidase